jgi:hypothetical protein
LRHAFFRGARRTPTAEPADRAELQIFPIIRFGPSELAMANELLISSAAATVFSMRLKALAAV